MNVMVLCPKKMSFYLKRKLIETRKTVINTYNPYVTSKKTDKEISIFHLEMSHFPLQIDFQLLVTLV